jgi:hypothetical protein
VKKINPLLLAIVLSLSVSYSLAQKRDYILTDSVLILGIDIIENIQVPHAPFIRFMRKGKEITYTVEEVLEYGLKDGTVYESKQIPLDGEAKRAFLQQLEKGKISLFRYEDRESVIFFLQKDSSDLLEFQRDKKSFVELSQDCEYISVPTKIASFHQNSLKNLVAFYNACEKKPFPYPKVGIQTGLSQGNLQLSTDFFNLFPEGISFDQSFSMLIGIYADLPIKRSSFSFHTGFYFSKNGYSASLSEGQSDVDIVINVSSIQIPVLFRYTVPKMDWRPFINLGGTVRYHYENTGTFYKSVIEDDVVTISEPIEEEFLSDIPVMFSAGIGLQKNIDYRKTISAEIRYSQFPGNDTFLGENSLTLFIGFSF